MASGDPRDSEQGENDAATGAEPDRAHVFVSGRVQGVGYRASTRRAARRHGVDGWVRNLEDGRVEAVFEGDSAAVDAMIEWCHEGSPSAEVTGVDVDRDEAPRGVDGFDVRW